MIHGRSSVYRHAIVWNRRWRRNDRGRERERERVTTLSRRYVVVGHVRLTHLPSVLISSCSRAGSLDYPELWLPRGTCHVIYNIICVFDTPAQNRHLNEKQRSEAWDLRACRSGSTVQEGTLDETKYDEDGYYVSLVHNREQSLYIYMCIHQMRWKNRVHRLVPTPGSRHGPRWCGGCSVATLVTDLTHRKTGRSM